MTNSHRAIRLAIPWAALPIATLTGQVTAKPQRTTAEYLVVGRAETAQVTLDYPANVAATYFEWSTAPQPLVPGNSGPTTLRTSLPITIGGVAVPAGEYHLAGAMEEGRMLVVATGAGVGSATQPPALRIPLDAREVGGSAGVITIGIRGTRHGADTLVFAYGSSPRGSVVDIQMAPGSTFLLVIDHGRWRLTAPVTAR
jgi:hypothetical protein